uniref:Agnestins biosynthesis cluster transcription factor AgnL11 n=1 Tax=Paecilomyces divaricatus TaxID=644132 RepID=AGN11_PAEDI|nr:RecName: Full=Agnestins biosynthesis cluster transcription factor AgnL11; AltName: Full=Agnestins biosynthesis cluster protein L11 [Paecilomyces divaricatus]QBG38877.1 transcription factor [Paecilomyces divaricatus]
MKRSFDASHGQLEKQSRPRQVPTSCHFCRTKKLKCDRRFPCSNCRARRLSCVPFSDRSQAASLDLPGAGPSSTVSNEELSENINELKARLQRLEELISVNAEEKLDSKGPTSFVTSKGGYGEDVEASKSMNSLEMDAFEHQPLHSNSEERIAQLFASSFVSIIAPAIRLVIDQPTLSLLPSRKQAERLFDYFADQVVVFYYFIHVPTVRSMLDTVYTHLENKRQPQHDHLALLSTVFALSAYFGSSSSRFPFNGAEAKMLCYRWISVAQQALCAANYIVQPTVETLQSVILIAAYLVPNLGSMSIFRVLMASALQGALQLSLHQIDSPANQRRRQNATVNWVDIESKRRIWWHLASTDWIVSFMSGPRCGTYMIHPKQMTVDLPTNVDDQDIRPAGNYAQPLENAPTDMTFSILRTRISVIFREIVDAATDSGCLQEELPYDVVLAFDHRLHGIMADAPACFRTDPRSSRAPSRSPDLRLHRLIANALNRLHRPYLARGARDPKYSYSRMVCLRTARSVIELCKEMTGANEEFQHVKMWTIVHPLFNSVLVLVMDYCLNREEPRGDERKAEILEGFRLLEACQEDSALAQRGLQQMRQLLKGSASARKDKNPIHGDTDRATPPGSSNLPQHDKSSSSSPAPPVWPCLWTDPDLAPLETMDFDVDLDESQFEVLFRDFEGRHPMY